MTNYSLNGWVAPPPLLATGTIPGTTKKITMRKEVLPLFLAYLSEWHKTVHSIDYPGCLGPDGYEYRESRTGAGLSNHSSGTAADVTYDWLKADRLRHMNASQITAVHNLLNKYVTSKGKRIFGWGGDWTVGTYCDEMHTELIQSWSPGSQGANATLADVQDVLKRLGINSDGTFAKPQPSPAPKPPVVLPTVDLSNLQAAAAKDPKAPQGYKTYAAGTALVEKALVSEGLLPAIWVDGSFGTQTVAAYAAWQRRLGYTGVDANGIPGMVSLTKLGAKHGFKVVA